MLCHIWVSRDFMTRAVKMNILIVTSVSFCMLYFETVLGFSGQVCNRFPESLASHLWYKMFHTSSTTGHNSNITHFITVFLQNKILCGPEVRQPQRLDGQGSCAISAESYLALLDCIGGKRFQSSCWLRERFRHIWGDMLQRVRRNRVYRAEC